MRALILACSATKRGEQAPLPAIERYDGPAYRILRRHPLPPMLILSAQFGLIGPQAALPPYDRLMDRKQADAWAADARQGIILGEWLAAVRPSELLVWGGALYRDCTAALLRQSSRTPPVTYSSGGIGVQLGQIKRWLEGQGAGGS